MTYFQKVVLKSMHRPRVSTYHQNLKGTPPNTKKLLQLELKPYALSRSK